MNYIAIVMLFVYQTGAQKSNSIANIDWQESPTKSPIWSSDLSITNDGGVVGYYEEKIFLLGGSHDFQGIYIYNISSASISTKALTFPDQIKHPNGFSQYYTQLENNLYFIPSKQDKYHYKVYKFDLKTQKLDANPGIIAPSGSFRDACLASFDHGGEQYLGILGGYDANSATLATVIFFHFNQPNPWILSPTLKMSRAAAACIFHGGYLWAIG